MPLFRSLGSSHRWLTGGIAALLVLALAGEASAARKARADGFYRVGRGQVNLPLQFVLSVMTTDNMTAGIGMTGHHSIPIGFPNDDLMVADDITLSGKGSSLAVRFPQHVISGGYSALLALMGPDNVQITTMFTQLKWPNTSFATFTKSGGPGGTTFCPLAPGVAAPGCYAIGSGPPKGTGGSGTTRNGRVVYTGGTGFGGTARLFQAGGGLVTRPGSSPHGFGDPIFWAANEVFGGTGGLGVLGGYSSAGGPYGGARQMTGLTEVNMLQGAMYTQPKTAPAISGTMATIMSTQAGPYVTIGSGLTSCPTTGGMGFPNIPNTGSNACVVGTGPLLTGGSATTTNTGLIFTDATVFAQQTTNPDNPDFFTVTGSNGLSSRGIGNLVLVAGGMAKRTNNSQPTGAAGASVDTLSITITEKAPSMSPGGFAAAALLMLLGAGYAMRRRF